MGLVGFGCGVVSGLCFSGICWLLESGCCEAGAMLLGLFDMRRIMGVVLGFAFGVMELEFGYGLLLLFFVCLCVCLYLYLDLRLRWLVRSPTGPGLVYSQWPTAK